MRLLVSSSTIGCLLALAGSACAQVTFPNFNNNTYYTLNPTWQHLGWRTASKYVVFDAEQNGHGAIEDYKRYVVWAVGNSFTKVWTHGDNGSPLSLATQSASWLASHPSSGLGSTKYTFPGPYYVGGKIPTVANLKTSLAFTHAAKTYTLQLNNYFGGPIEKTPDGLNGFRRAKFTLKIKRGTGAFKVLQQDTTYFRPVIMYGIDKVNVSPDGQKVAVYLVKYDCGFFEGWNVATVRMVVTGKLP